MMSLKFGIIGYGGMGEWHHRHLRKMSGLEVTAAHDIRRQRVELAEQAGLRGYHRLADFLSADDIDVVIVAVPNDVHMELAIASMAAGKHVLCEKPVALSVAQFDEMLASAKRHNVVFAVNQNRRWDKDFCQVKQAVEQGLIGKPFVFESRIQGPNGAIHGWRGKKAHGGGMLLDWGVHIIDQVLSMITSDIAMVHCIMRSIKAPEVDDYFRLQIEFVDGQLAYFEVCLLALSPLPRWWVGGADGTLVIDKIAGDGRVIVMQAPAKVSTAPLRDNPAGPTRTFGDERTAKQVELPLPQVAPKWTDLYLNLADVISGKADLVVKPEEVRRVLGVIEAAFASHEKNAPIYMEKGQLSL